APGAKNAPGRGRAPRGPPRPRRGFGPTVALAAAAIALPAAAPALATNATELAVRFVTSPGTVPPAILSLLSSGVRPMSAKIAFGAVALMGVATTVGFGVLRGGSADQPGRADDPPAAAKAKAPAGGPEPERTSPTRRAAAGDGRTKESPSGLTAEMARFRALTPAERLKHVEKLAGADAPVAAATRGDLAAAVVERGSIEPAGYADLICKVKAKDKETPATTIKWVIDEGSLVKKGDQLALLDDSGIREQFQATAVKAKEAEAAVAVAEENVKLALHEGEAEIRLAEIDVKLAAVEFKGSKELLDLKVEQAKLKLD